jgi:hypothetical protein
MDVEMAATDIQDEDIAMKPQPEEDIEFQLQHLREYENEKQLDLLRREIGHIVVHGLQPSEGWYDERFEHINQYSKLDWTGLAQRFRGKDDFIYQLAQQTHHLLGELLEERSTKPNFHLQTYRMTLHNIHAVWNYYKQLYMGDEQDTDIMNLIEGIKFM